MNANRHTQHNQNERNRKPVLKSRNFNGYYQTLQPNEAGSHPSKRQWQFTVMGFDTCGTTAKVRKWDGSCEGVPVNNHGKILILGQWFSDDCWQC